MPEKRTNERVIETPTIAELFTDMMGVIWGNSDVDLSIYYEEFHHAFTTARQLGARVEKETLNDNEQVMVVVRFRDSSMCSISADGGTIED